MTQTLPKRTIRTTSPPQLQTRDGRAFRFDRGQDAPTLALRLRTLAIRAHEALNASVPCDDTISERGTTCVTSRHRTPGRRPALPELGAPDSLCNRTTPAGRGQARLTRPIGSRSVNKSRRAWQKCARALFLRRDVGQKARFGLAARKRLTQCQRHVTPLSIKQILELGLLHGRSEDSLTIV